MRLSRFLLATVTAAIVGLTACDDSSAESREGLIDRINANAEGAVWKNGAFGYFERNHAASLSENGEIEVSYDQCIVWGPPAADKDVDGIMALCGTGHFKWRKTRLAIALTLIDDTEVKIISGDAKIRESGHRVAFNCANRIMGCAQQREGVAGKAAFGILCTDLKACGETAAHILRLVELAKTGD